MTRRIFRLWLVIGMLGWIVAYPTILAAAPVLSRVVATLTGEFTVRETIKVDEEDCDIPDLDPGEVHERVYAVHNNGSVPMRVRINVSFGPDDQGVNVEAIPDEINMQANTSTTFRMVYTATDSAKADDYTCSVVVSRGY